MFILSEDFALKEHLKGMAVSDGNSSHRNVGVWFRQPDREITDQTYPYCILDLIDISPARERMHSDNPVHLFYRDSPVPLQEGEDILWDRPTPVNLDYQVTAYARNPLHDRQITPQLLKRLPMRGGLLNVVHDNGAVTGRRLDFLDLMKRDRIEDLKRLFMTVITVRVSSEIESDRYKILAAPPTSVALGMPQDP